LLQNRPGPFPYKSCSIQCPPVNVSLRAVYAGLLAKKPARELHRPSDRHLSAKLVRTLCGYRVSRGQPNGILRSYSLFSRPELLLFLPSSSSVVPHEAEWTPFQTHYFSENLVAQGIKL
jgi:hypothetical protein